MNYKDKFNQYLYYIIIAVISVIALTFLPAIGSTAGLDWNIPTTAVGWIVWVTVRICVAVINVLIFHSFMCQAKINVKGDEHYKKAVEILMLLDEKEKLPRSPKRYYREQWTYKGVSIFLSSALATVALTQAILSYDYVSMLTYLFTITLGIIFGIMQMKSVETYLTVEMYEYALMKQKEKIENDKNRQQDLKESTGTSTLQ